MADWQIHWYDEVNSTNTVLKAWLMECPDLASGIVLAARRQNAGRGRYQRHWFSTPDRDLTFSILYRAPVDMAWLPSLPMAVAAGIAHLLEQFGLNAQLKWPNDVLVRRQKICGILSEFITEEERNEELPTRTAIIGVGFNVNSRTEDLRHISRPTTSLFMETGIERPLNDVLEMVLQSLEEPLAAWESGGFPPLRETWRKLSPTLGEHIHIGEASWRHMGTHEDYGDHGELLLRKSSGELYTAVIGDVLENPHPGRPAPKWWGGF